MIGFRGWIPPLPLAAGLLFQVTAWALVLADAGTDSFGVRLAWVHAVGLGWLTVTALSVLLHVTPEFTDLPWRGESVARAALAVVVPAVLVLVAAFAAAAPLVLEVAGALAAAAILAYVLVALGTLLQRAPNRTSAAVARAFFGTFVALGATVALGAALARAYAVGDARVLSLAPAHAWLGIGAWLTLLVTGVSTRTFRPMLGIARGNPLVHIVVGTALALGVAIAAVGAPGMPALLHAGAAVAAGGALVYAGSTLVALRGATTPHLVPRAFVAASATWLVLAAFGSLAAAFGLVPGAPIVVIALAGWLGQMVYAHWHHIGVRVLATVIRGPDDETRPWTVLQPQLGWLAFGSAQVAVVATAWRAAGGPADAAWLGGSAGLVALAAFVANATRATYQLRSAPR